MKSDIVRDVSFSLKSENLVHLFTPRQIRKLENDTSGGTKNRAVLSLRTRTRPILYFSRLLDCRS